MVYLILSVNVNAWIKQILEGVRQKNLHIVHTFHREIHPIITHINQIIFWSPFTPGLKSSKKKKKNIQTRCYSHRWFCGVDLLYKLIHLVYVQ